MPKRTFVTGGPVVPEENYFVKREKELADFLRRVEQGKYIVIFAPGQTGKTTFFYQALKALEEDFTDYLSQSGEIQMDELLDNFRDFIGRAGYKIEGQTEVFPFQNPFLQGREIEVPETPQEFVGQYLLLAYLNLFVRKISGHLYPEVPTGRGWMDIIILYRGEKHIVETKLWRGEKRYQYGKQQLAEYLSKEGVQRGYYIVFDHRKSAQPKYERELVTGKEIISYCIPIPTPQGGM